MVLLTRCCKRVTLMIGDRVWLRAIDNCSNHYIKTSTIASKVDRYHIII
ncbi:MULTISPECIES: hypothetical protein [unclassified Microcoleus]